MQYSPGKANRKKQKWMTDHILILMENRKQFKKVIKMNIID